MDQPAKNAKDPRALLDLLPGLHTTPLGERRIRENLSLPEDADPAAWCRDAIAAPGTAILRRGKNWYAMAEGCTITVNAKSLTIITAHRRD